MVWLGLSFVCLMALMRPVRGSLLRKAATSGMVSLLVVPLWLEFSHLTVRQIAGLPLYVPFVLLLVVVLALIGGYVAGGRGVLFGLGQTPATRVHDAPDRLPSWIARAFWRL